MKQLLIRTLCLTMILLPVLLSAQETKVSDVKMKSKEDRAAMKASMIKDASYAYIAEYSSDFEVGNPADGKLILDIWKSWDDNDLDRLAGNFSDTMMMETPTGDILKGKEAFMAGSKQYRATFTNVKSNVEVWIPLKSKDRNENWVAIWGREEDTDKDGKVTTNMLHEIWRINKDGKVDFMRQYTARPSMQ